MGVGKAHKKGKERLAQNQPGRGSMMAKRKASQPEEGGNGSLFDEARADRERDQVAPKAGSKWARPASEELLLLRHRSSDEGRRQIIETHALLEKLATQFHAGFGPPQQNTSDEAKGEGFQDEQLIRALDIFKTTESPQAIEDDLLLRALKPLEFSWWIASRVRKPDPRRRPKSDPGNSQWAALAMFEILRAARAGFENPQILRRLGSEAHQLLEKHDLDFPRGRHKSAEKLRTLMSRWLKQKMSASDLSAKFTKHARRDDVIRMLIPHPWGVPKKVIAVIETNFQRLLDDGKRDPEVFIRRGLRALGLPRGIDFFDYIDKRADRAAKKPKAAKSC